MAEPAPERVFGDRLDLIDQKSTGYPALGRRISTGIRDTSRAFLDLRADSTQTRCVILAPSLINRPMTL